jgi:hypothetical protein
MASPTLTVPNSGVITVDGISYASRASAAAHFGIQEKTVIARIKYGWSVDDAFRMPVRKWKLL